MVMKKDRRKHDIKSKLVAAICMLLVSSIMMVSSTYAWFTLSTAPEVTGITTAIGANGNLEMALMPTGATIVEALAAIKDASVGNSTVDINTTWGNLVNLKDSKYGLNDITLYPSTLGEVSNAKLPSNMLSIPTYGSDGRISGFSNGALNKIYTAGSFKTDGFGVRAVGTASGMSAHEMAYRNVLSNADTSAGKALASVQTAVSDGGSVLADIAVKKATQANAAYGQADISSLKKAYGYVNTAITNIETALKQYIIADYLAQGGLDETTFAEEQTKMEALDLAGLVSGNYVKDANIPNYITALATLKGDVNALLNGGTYSGTSMAGLSTMTGDSYEWADIRGYITPLADIDKMLLNGNTIESYLNGSSDVSGLTSGTRYLQINAKEGYEDNGIYVQLADFVGSFTAPCVISELTYGTITLKDLAITMDVKANENPAYLVSADTAASEYPGTPFGSGAGNITDFYGYIIDMAFRTNATDSDLLLQTEGVDRIYSDNKANPDTMGGGSTMSYTAAANSGYTTDQLKNLMRNIRIVLFDPETMTIFGYARLDMDNATAITETNGDTTVTAEIKMWNNGTPGDADGNGAVAAGWADSQKIVSLLPNTPTAVSTLVYLDGENLTNADIGNANITGKMNLQFSSSAELKPMEYGNLREGNGETEEETQPVTLKNVSSQTYTIDTAAYSEGKVAILLTAGAAEGDNVVVTIDGTTYDATVVSTQGVLGVAVTAADVTADTVITVEPKT